MGLNKEEIIEKLQEISSNLVLIQWCEIEGDMSIEMANMIRAEIIKLNECIKKLEQI